MQWGVQKKTKQGKSIYLGHSLVQYLGNNTDCNLGYNLDCYLGQECIPVGCVPPARYPGADPGFGQGGGPSF